MYNRSVYPQNDSAYSKDYPGFPLQQQHTYDKYV